MHISWVWKGALCIMYQKGTTFISRMYIKYTNLTAITTTDVYTEKKYEKDQHSLESKGISCTNNNVLWTHDKRKYVNISPIIPSPFDCVCQYLCSIYIT